MRSTEDRLKEIVHKLLHGPLGGEQPREVDLGDELVGALVLLIVRVVAHQVPHFDSCTQEKVIHGLTGIG